MKKSVLNNGCSILNAGFNWGKNSFMHLNEIYVLKCWSWTKNRRNDNLYQGCRIWFCWWTFRWRWINSTEKSPYILCLSLSVEFGLLVLIFALGHSHKRRQRHHHVPSNSIRDVESFLQSLLFPFCFLVCLGILCLRFIPSIVLTFAWYRSYKGKFVYLFFCQCLRSVCEHRKDRLGENFSF